MQAWIENETQRNVRSELRGSSAEGPAPNLLEIAKKAGLRDVRMLRSLARFANNPVKGDEARDRAWVDKMLGEVKVGVGKPGLSWGHVNLSRGPLSYGVIEIAYRDQDGKAVAMARLTTNILDEWHLHTLAADPSRGLLTGRAVFAVASEALKHITDFQPGSLALSPDGALFMSAVVKKILSRLTEEEKKIAGINAEVRSELRSQEASEVLRVYQSLIAWRVSSILERGLLRPMTARAMIESGEIAVPLELSEALLPFGLDVRQLLFASSADAKLAPEAYKENDKGALVVIEDIQNPENFADASYYEDYDDYIRIKVRGLTQGSPYRSPVSVIAERDFSDVQLELEARGAGVLNERLENSGMVLLSTDTPYEVLEEEAEYRDGPNILGFRQISAEQIEAFFVPEAAYEQIVELLPEAIRAKVIPVSGKKDLREMDGDAPEGLTAPAWDEALSAFLKSYPWKGRAGRNFMLHGTRFDTPSEIKERVNNRSELRTDSSALAAESSLDGLARTAGENLIRFYREEDIAGLDLSVAQAVARGAAVNFENFIDALIRAVEDSLGSETESYSKLILEAMREIASKIKETDYPQKKGVFVLSPSVQRAELDLSQVNAYKDALAQAAGFIDSLYYRFKDNAVLREAVRDAGIQRFQPVSNFSSIRAPEDIPALPLLTAGREKQDARSTLPFMQIGIFYPDHFERGDSSVIEETFAVFMQFVFGYVAQNELSRSDFEFLNQLQALASEAQTAEAVMDLYDQKTSAQGPLKARARVELIKAALIQPLTEILGEAAPQLLGGLELGSPGILVGQIAESMKAYEAVRKSA